jgi:fatty-acyl-CoA synthase
MNFNWVLDSVADQVPVASADKPALGFNAQASMTYRELREQSLRYAEAMRELGLRKGDRLALLMYNDADYVPLYLAAARLGVITVRLNFRLAPAEIGFILGDSSASVAIIHSSLLAKAEQVRRAGVATYVVLPDSDDPVPDWAVPFDALRGREPLATEDAPEVAADDAIALIYTSGTTGSPKGAIWTHGNTLAAATAQALRWQFSEDTVALVPGPLYHVAGFESLISAALLMHGKGIHLASRGLTVERVLDVVREEQVTDCLVFTFQLSEILRLDDLEARVPPSLRRMITGGDTLMPWVFDEFRRRLPGVELSQVYGSTETGSIATTLEHRFFADQPKSVGRPLPSAEVRVVKSDGVLAGVDEVGEISVRSAAVCAGYWQRPEANERTFDDGWCRTGDLGTVNAGGFLTLAGRAKDMIRSGGENIYPAEVEKVLTLFPGIKDAAVIGVPDERFTEVGCAVLVVSADDPPDDDALRSYCRERLAGYKVPKHFVRVDELPRNASGKVVKYMLSEQYHERFALSAPA